MNESQLPAKWITVFIDQQPYQVLYIVISYCYRFTRHQKILQTINFVFCTKKFPSWKLTAQVFVSIWEASFRFLGFTNTQNLHFFFQIISCWVFFWDLFLFRLLYPNSDFVLKFSAFLSRLSLNSTFPTLI